MIRDVGFLCWKQKTAWMEHMSGTRWNNMVKKENKLFKETVQKVANQTQLFSKSHEFMEADESMFFSHKNIIIKVAGGGQYIWFYVNNKKTYIVSDIAVSSDLIYTTREIGEGAQKYRVECIKDGKVLWYKDNVGPKIYVKNNKCYVLGADILWYNSLIILDAHTGKLVETMYEETDKRYNLSFIKGEDALFLIRENSGKEDLYIIENSLKRIESEATLFYPIGYYKKKLCYLENINNVWHSKGFTLKSFSHQIEYFSLEKDRFVLIEHGLKVIYNLDFKKLFSFYGELITNPLKGNTFFIDFTGANIQEFSFDQPIRSCSTPYCNVTREFAKSIDNTHVPYILAIPSCKAKGLMVIGYGAYGISTNLSTRRWKPYITDGWIICFALVRGGGDVNKEWADQAKTYNKYKSCEDFEACIYAVQKHYSISPLYTCIYGRSAGGYLIGMAVAHDSGLFKMVYTEVPYVDILRTTTNPSLPLTSLEFDEFGNPKRSIYEFQKILEMSPVDSLTKVPDLFVLIRTSENDTQVYAYESYKWLDALRGNKNDKKKLLYYSEKKGHIIIGEDMYKNFSEDFYLLKTYRDVKT